MIPKITEINFPEYATLSQATVTINDMGERTITARVKIDGSIVPDFSFDWAVEFKGERYIQPLRQPQAGKNDSSASSFVDLTFHHWAIWQMKRYYFVEMTSTESGTAIADQYIASLGLNLPDFCSAFNRVLSHYFGDAIKVDLNPQHGIALEPQYMSISYSYIWDVLQKVYEVYGVRWDLVTNEDGSCSIRVGYSPTILSHTFQYGYDGGLLSIERQVQDSNIRNSLLGRGGEQNLPAYYFKEAPEGSLFASDPDAIPELANIYFSNLRGKTFRDYVKGWKAKRYGGTPMAEPTEAYTKGYTDKKFNPVEYVNDNASIDKYGLLQGALDNNEDIYPSIKGAPNGEDVVVYVEPVTSDDVEQSVGKTERVALDGLSQFKNIERDDEGTLFSCVLNSEVFEVPDGHYALNIGNSATYTINNLGVVVYETDVPHIEVSEYVFNADTGQEVSKDDLVGGRYKVRTHFKLTIPVSPYWDENASSNPFQFMWHIATIGVMTNMELIRLQDGATDKWLPTFNIWVKNIWNSTRNSGENDLEYAERVWRPILGDRQGNEAKVVFSSGWLSGHEDYEFTIVDFAYDNTKSYEGSKSEWRLTLAKSDAELDATGKYIPSASTNGQAHAGDTFFFIGIDMPYQYVLWAEERLDNYKTAALNEVSEIQPKWVVRFDKLRLHEGDDNLAEQIAVGGAINIADVRFIDAPALQLYLQSVTYTWNEQTTLYPDIEVVLADTIVPVQSPVAQLQGSIDAINSQLYNIGNVAQTVRKIGDSLYLRKDGVEDTSKSPTKFAGNVSGHNFRRGKVGGADWGIYRDEHGNAIAEFDKIIARKDLEVNNLVINQVSYVGGKQITSAAALTISRVIEGDAGYQCFFDQKGGSVANLFAVNDIAYSQRFDQENNATKYYKRVVAEVGLDYITLSKTNVDGDGEPMANDVVIHYGNTADANRQYVIIKDIIGGGYERMLSGLNSVSATGVEYYFAGRTNGNTPRWFVGDKSQQYIEYKDGHLRIIADVTLGENSVLPDSLNVDYLKQAFPQGSVLDVNGVTLSALIGVKDEDGKIVAGLYGGASDELNSKGYADDTHGAMLLFGGINGADKPTTYKTAIFEDGYIESEYFATARTGARVEMFDNQVKIFGSDGSTHILMGWNAETGNPELQYVDANGTRPWLITSQGISNAVTIDTYQRILNVKDFDKGLKIGGISVSKLEGKDIIYLDGNLVVRGGITMYGDNGQTLPSIWDAFPYDDRTIKRNAAGEFYAVGGGGSGTGGLDLTGTMVINALGYAPLSTSGGTITATGRRQLSLQSSTDAQAALWLGTGLEQFSKGGFLQYDYSNGSIALVSFSAMANSYSGLAGLFIKRDNRITVGDANLSVEYDVLHSGNYSKYAVKKNMGINTAIADNEYGYGYFDGGWPEAGPAMVFGVGNYKAGVQVGAFGSAIRYGYTAGATSFTWRTILDDSNYSDYALPITGGTVNGAITINDYAKVTNDIYLGGVLRNANATWLLGESALDGTITIGSGSYAQERCLQNYNGKLRLTAEGGVEAQLTYLDSDPTLGALDTKGVVRQVAGSYGWGLYSWVRNTGNGYIQVGSDSRYAAPEAFNLILQVLGGNVAIGGTTASEKLHVHGNMLFDGERVLKSSLIGEVLYMGGSYLVIGGGTTTKGIPTYIDGKTVYVRAGNYVATFSDAGGLTWNGNLLTNGAITMYYSSDERLKKNIRKVNASEVLMSLGGVWQYEYIDSEVQKNSVYDGTHFGLIYQNVKGKSLDKMCHKREDGMGTLNYVDADFISIIAGATMENISEAEKLKKEIKALRREVELLKQRVA